MLHSRSGYSLTGTSYCDYTYRISRTLAQSDVYVIEYIISGEGTININGISSITRGGRLLSASAWNTA